MVFSDLKMSNGPLIGVMGKKGSGKDTVADYLVKNYSFSKTAFAEPVKHISKIMFNFTDEQLYGNEKEKIDPIWGISPRDAFQKIGTDFGQYDLQKYFPALGKKIGKNIWTERIRVKYEKDKEKTVICDVRFIHEVNMILETGGIIIKINRDDIKEDLHISENEMMKIENNKITHIIDNNGSLQDLYEQVGNIMNSL